MALCTLVFVGNLRLETLEPVYQLLLVVTYSLQLLLQSLALQIQDIRGGLVERGVDVSLGHLVNLVL